MSLSQVELELRKKAAEQREEYQADKIELAESILESFSGPGGPPRYKDPEKARMARLMYMRAYHTVWGSKKDKCNDYIRQSQDEVRKASKKIRKRRPPDVRAFHVTMLSAEVAECFYCKKELEMWERQADHYIPISRGGKHIAENLVICCGSCNASKGNKMPDEFMPL